MFPHFSPDNLQPCSSKTSLAHDDLSFDTSYASVSFIEYTLNRAYLFEADAMARLIKHVCIVSYMTLYFNQD